MTVLHTLMDRITGHTRITLTEDQRMLVIDEGRFTDILGAGRHRVKTRAVTETFRIATLRFNAACTRALFRAAPDLAARHLTEIRTGPQELALVLREGKPVDVVTPDGWAVLWTDAGPFEVERVDLTGGLGLEAALMRRLQLAGLGRALCTLAVADGHVGMVFVDGVLTDQVGPGVHGFWNAGRAVGMKAVDLRARTHEVNGQEVLTKDRVTVRVNLTAGFRITDPERAVTAVKDFEEALHRALQLALRRRMAGLTLDQLLTEKGAVEEMAEVRTAMEAIGIALGEVALRDVILPGEMRDILNRVVAAEKEAEANVIRRREETNATRALLNTAKVMAENPVMLRLKELEALEGIAAKVDQLTVHNGTAGLMEDIARLRP